MFIYVFNIKFNIVLQITLELIMWIIFAGVSIFMTIIFILDDVYSSKTHHDIQRKYSRTTLSNKHFQTTNFSYS